jgi:hypothetical protein
MEVGQTGDIFGGLKARESDLTKDQSSKTEQQQKTLPSKESYENKRSFFSFGGGGNKISSNLNYEYEYDSSEGHCWDCGGGPCHQWSRSCRGAFS